LAALTVSGGRAAEASLDAFAKLTAKAKAAIIAQIAITMPGLENFGSIHWAATAFAYTSLVCGLISTFLCFYVQKILSDLHRPEDLHEWLTEPRDALSDRLSGAIARVLTFKSEKEKRTGGEAPKNDRIPSVTAAAVLLSPSQLLQISIGALFVALGVYLGTMYTEGLGSLKGRDANLSVLIFFIVFSVVAIILVQLPLYVKSVDRLTSMLLRVEDEENIQDNGCIELQELPAERHEPIQRLEPIERLEPVDEQESVNEHQSLQDYDEDYSEEDSDDDLPIASDAVLDALRASIQAQEESLRAQKMLLQLLDARNHRRRS
jgi:hypothetical protein